VTGRWLFDTSVYVAVLRDEAFAREFRPRYLRDVPRTHFSSIVARSSSPALAPRDTSGRQERSTSPSSALVGS